MKYCLPIVKNMLSDIEKIISEELDDFDFFEIWLDYIEDLELKKILALVEKFPECLIFLFRRKELKPEKMNKELKNQIIESLKEKPVYFDFDIKEQKNDLDNICGSNLNLIASYHNYTETPGLDFLLAIVQEMEPFQPKIYKIACFCKTKEDAITLLNLASYLKKIKKDIIILGMGEFGYLTRIFASLWYNELFFSPLSNEESTAPGQLNKKQFEEIKNILGLE